MAMIECDECGAERATLRGMYWHFRIDHELDHEDAYYSTANCSLVNGENWPIRERFKSSGKARGDLPYGSEGQAAWSMD